MSKKKHAVETVRSLLNDESFKEEHRTNSKYFSRNRKLTFVIVVLLILEKSLKSIQLVLNEFFVKLSAPLNIVTASAFTQARAKLAYTAFIELNQKAIVEIYYRDDDYKKWRDFRVLAIDGSKIILPNEEEIRRYFGVIRIANQDKNVTGEYPVALASVMYDVLNNISLDAMLGHAKAYEVDLAVEHLEFAKTGDLLTFDRNYPSYRFLAELTQKNIDFAGRCSKSSFKEARMMFDNDAEESKIVTLTPHHTKMKEIKELGLPTEIKVRFVRIILDNGEIEILVTSLLDENLYSTSDLKELYHLRWGIETYYGTIKGRLNLENFSGKSVEAVKQDFYSIIFVSGLESLLIEDAQEELDKNEHNKYPRKVNKAVSFNTIKNYIIELFYKEESIETLCDIMTTLFMTNPVCLRKQREVPRNKSKPRKIVNYQKRIKKICF